MTKRARQLLGLLALVLVATCCTSVHVAPTPTPTAYAFYAQVLVPEDWYEDVYEHVYACIAELGYAKPAREVAYADIVWLITVASAMGDIAGLFSPSHRIYLDVRYVMSSNIVGHEIAHYITGVGHDRPEIFDAILATCVDAMMLPAHTPH